MATLSENLRTEISVASTALGGRVHKNAVPQSQAQQYPRAWFQRSAQNDTPDLDGTAGGWLEEFFDVEVMSGSASEAEATAEMVRSYLHCKRGTFGAGTIKACFVNDADDDYEPKGIGADSGVSIVALQVRILHGN